jgi:hypothetical protein
MGVSEARAVRRAPQVPSGVRTFRQWGTHLPPVGYAPYPSGVRTFPQWGTHLPPVGYTPSPSGVHIFPQWGTPRPPLGYAPSPNGYHPFPSRDIDEILRLTIVTRSANIPNHRIRIRKNEGSGGCRRYGRAGKAHQTCTGAGVEFSPPAAGFRGVYTPREYINRKYRRVAATSSRWPLALVDES